MVRTGMWALLLLVLAQRFAVSVYPNLLELDFEFAAQSTALGLAYLVLAIIGIGWFALRCQRRSHVLWITSLVLLGLQWQSQFFGWGRLTLFWGLLLLSLLIVEIIRQNRPLVKALRARGTPVRPLLLKALFLWSPLGLVALAGFYLNGKIVDGVTHAIYETTPIDRFCEVRTRADITVAPCSDIPLDELLARQRPAAVDHVLTLELERRFLAAGRNLLARISEAGDAARDLHRDMDPVLILGLTGAADPAESRIRSDKIAVRLRQAIGRAEQAVRDARPPAILESSALPGFIREPMLASHRQEEARRRKLLEALELLLSARINVIRKQLREAESDEVAERQARADGLAYDMQLHLSRLFGVEMGRNAAPATTAPQAEQMAFVIRALDRIEAMTRKLVLERARNTGDIVYAALRMSPQCTVASKDPDVKDAEDNSVDRNVGLFPCVQTGDDDATRVLPLGLNQSAELSIDRWQSARERDGMRRLRAVSRASYSTSTEAAAELKASGGLIPGEIHLGRKRCHVILRPGNCVTNMAKSSAESVWGDVHDSASDSLSASVDAGARGGAETVDEWVVRMRTQLYATLDATGTALRAMVARTDQVAGLISILLAILLVVAVVKSLLFVIATRLFDADGVAHIDMGESETRQGDYETGSSVTIPRSFTQPMITRVTLDNQDNGKVLAPWPASAPVSRILRRAYFLFTRGGHFSHGEQPMHFSRANGQHIIKWNMVEGEEVVFSYRDFFGASANIQLKRTISLRLSTILLGRVIFHSAVCQKGDGCLLLTVKGTVIDHRQTDSTTLDRLIAWNRHTRFRVASSGTLKSVFLDGYTVMRERDEGEPSGLIVVEAIGDDRNAVAGALQFIKMLFLPF